MLNEPLFQRYSDLEENNVRTYITSTITDEKSMTSNFSRIGFAIFGIFLFFIIHSVFLTLNEPCVCVCVGVTD